MGDREDEELFFQHDGAAPHFSLTVRAWLDDHFPDRWIGRRGAIEWPPRSPDLTPPDFFLWGVLKDLVYSEKPRTIAALKDVICNKIAMIELDLCRKVCRSVPSRLQECIEAQGAPTELF